MFFCSTLILGGLGACSSTSSSSTKSSTEKSSVQKNDKEAEVEEEQQYQPKLTRKNLTNKLKRVEKKYNSGSIDDKTALEYAKTLFELGNFDDVEKVIQPFLKEEQPNPEALNLAAKTNYLKGNYEEAEKNYQSLLDNHYEEYGAEAELGMQMVYYQTNQYSKANKLFENKSEKEIDPFTEMLRSFEDETPNKVNWNGKEETTIPFIRTDPYPFIPIEVNGVKMNAFIDTGGIGLVVDKDRAKELGIESSSTDTGSFAGGKTADIEFGRVDSLKLGDVEIENVPTMMSSFEPWRNDEAFKDVKNVDAVIGTNVLKQFIPTIDFITGELKLVPKTEAGKHKVEDDLTNAEVNSELPFTLAGTHYTFTKGQVNGYKNLNMFVDSGLGDYSENAGVLLPKQTLDLLKIPIPTNLRKPKEIGLGGGDYREGIYDLDSLSLGDLKNDCKGKYFTEDTIGPLTDGNGFVADALVGHAYLKNYKWTLDYDEMKMTFSK